MDLVLEALQRTVIARERRWWRSRSVLLEVAIESYESFGGFIESMVNVGDWSSRKDM
jgi:hypothetical protein